MHSQIDVLRCDFNQEIGGVKKTAKGIEKSQVDAWAAIEDPQEGLKGLKDSKRLHQEMLDNLKTEFERLQSELKNLRAENLKLRPALQELQGKLMALENYTRKENLRFLNIPEEEGESWTDKHNRK